MWIFHIGSEAYGIVCSAMSTITPRRDWTCDYPLRFHKRIEEGEVHIALDRDPHRQGPLPLRLRGGRFRPEGQVPITLTAHGAGCTRREPKDLCPNCLDIFEGDHPEPAGKPATDRNGERATSGFETSRSTGGCR